MSTQYVYSVPSNWQNSAAPPFDAFWYDRGSQPVLDNPLGATVTAPTDLAGLLAPWGFTIQNIATSYSVVLNDTPLIVQGLTPAIAS
jgi:hypothetical protein